MQIYETRKLFGLNCDAPNPNTEFLFAFRTLIRMVIGASALLGCGVFHLDTWQTCLSEISRWDDVLKIHLLCGGKAGRRLWLRLDLSGLGLGILKISRTRTCRIRSRPVQTKKYLRRCASKFHAWVRRAVLGPRGVLNTLGVSGTMHLRSCCLGLVRAVALMQALSVDSS